MSFELIKKIDQEIWINITGQLSVEDYQQAMTILLPGLELHKESRVLIILKNFIGWSKDERWNDSQFMLDQADQIQKMAIVGDEKWKDDTFLFVGKPFRSTKIEFFSEDRLEQAKHWLSLKI